ncbi:RICIN domain-containing protein [Streptomyces sp. NPDC054932]
MTNGNKIDLYDCNDSAAQCRPVSTKRRAGHVTSGKVLEVTGGATANGTAVQPCTANTNKRQIRVTPK